MRTVAIIGVGKIGEAMLSGLLHAGWPADRLIATEPRRERADELAARYGIRGLTTRRPWSPRTSL